MPGALRAPREPACTGAFAAALGVAREPRREEREDEQQDAEGDDDGDGHAGRTRGVRQRRA